MNNKKTIMILILVLFIGIIGLSVAYFSNSTDIDNIFQTKPYGNVITEEFTSPSNWLPGQEIKKEITATNTGKVDQAVRIKLNEIWTPYNSSSTLNGWIHEDGTKSTHKTQEELENDERVAIINFDNASDWTYSNGYYYYNYKLSPNEETSSLIKSVTFNPNTKLDDTCVTTEGNGTKTITCNSSEADYDNATYTLSFTIETVQYNKYTDAWNTDVAIADEKQRMLKGLKVNVADATFATGDKTAMFEFSHPATEQTPALTDYRYIGHMPNNYVKFNCDNDGSNCEIWRIIGVFSVDDGDGNWEQRIKLVRGSSFSETMVWDNVRNGEIYGSGINKWDGSQVHLFLNTENNASTYGLKEISKLQIDDAKYYLGGIKSYSSDPHYGSTETIYSIERGSLVFNHNDFCSNYPTANICSSDYCQNNPTSCALNSVSWIGKVGLLYPSDNYYIYSKGVEDGCFNNPNKCYERAGDPSNEVINNHPETGWIYNSNNLEGQTNTVSTWLLTPNSGYLSGVFYISSSGYFDYNHGSGESLAVRPVVYLKSSINIISGEGTEQNPYILG